MTQVDYIEIMNIHYMFNTVVSHEDHRGSMVKSCSQTMKKASTLAHNNHAHAHTMFVWWSIYP